jgi:hypothetical protein
MIDKQIKDVITLTFFGLFLLFTPDILLIPVIGWGTYLAIPLIEQMRKSSKK